jgi:hypothetical protein
MNHIGYSTEYFGNEFDKSSEREFELKQYQIIFKELF